MEKGDGRPRKSHKPKQVFDLFEMPEKMHFSEVLFSCPENKNVYDGVNGPRWDKTLEDVKKVVCNNGEAPFLVWVTSLDGDGVHSECDWLEQRDIEQRIAKVEYDDASPTEENPNGRLRYYFGWFFAFRKKDEAMRFRLSTLKHSELVSINLRGKS